MNIQNIIDKIKNKKFINIVISIILIIILCIIIFSNAKNKKKEIVEEAPKFSTIKKGKEQQEVTKKKLSNFEKNVSEDEKTFRTDSKEVEIILKNRNIPTESFGENYIYNGINVYPVKGIEMKKTYNQVQSIRFNKRYKKEIVHGVKTTDELSEMIKKLGEPNYYGDGTLVYKTKDYYFIATKDDIVLYFIQNRKLDEFWELYDTFLKDLDLKKYINNLTDKYPEYTKYEYDSTGITLEYAQYGILINIKDTRKQKQARDINGEKYDPKENGLFIYSNYPKDAKRYLEYKKVVNKESNLILAVELRHKYEEQIKEEFKLPEVLSERDELYDTINTEDSYLKIEKKENKEKKEENNNNNKSGASEKRIKTPEKYNVYFEILPKNVDLKRDKRIYNVTIINKTNGLKFNISIGNYADYILLSENYLYYSITNAGIYRVNIHTGKKKKLYEGNGKFQLKYIKDGYLYLDRAKIKIN